MTRTFEAIHDELITLLGNCPIKGDCIVCQERTLNPTHATLPPDWSDDRKQICCRCGNDTYSGAFCEDCRADC